MGACPFRRLAVGPALDARFKRARAAQRRENPGCARRIVARGDHVPEAERIGLIFLLAREAQRIEPRARLRERRRDAGAEDRTDDLPKHAERIALGILLADMGVVGGDVADFVPERERELGLVVHQAHQLAGHVDIAAGNRERVFDRRIERGEMQCLTGIGDARIGADPPADRFDIGRARPGLRAAELLHELGMLALRLGDVLRARDTQLLRARPA